MTENNLRETLIAAYREKKAREEHEAAILTDAELEQAKDDTRRTLLDALNAVLYLPIQDDDPRITTRVEEGSVHTTIILDGMTLEGEYLYDCNCHALRLLDVCPACGLTYHTQWAATTETLALFLTEGPIRFTAHTCPEPMPEQATPNVYPPILAAARRLLTSLAANEDLPDEQRVLACAALVIENAIGLCARS